MSTPRSARILHDGVAILCTCFWFGLEALLHFNIGHLGCTPGEESDAAPSQPQHEELEFDSAGCGTGTATNLYFLDPRTWVLPEREQGRQLCLSIVVCALLSHMLSALAQKFCRYLRWESITTVIVGFCFVLEALLHFNIGRSHRDTWDILLGSNWEIPSQDEAAKILISVAVCTWLSEMSKSIILESLFHASIEVMIEGRDTNSQEAEKGGGGGGGGEEEEEEEEGLPRRKAVPDRILGLLISPPKLHGQKKVERNNRKLGTRKKSGRNAKGNANVKSRSRRNLSTGKKKKKSDGHKPTMARRSARIRNRAAPKR